ncbi:rhodanese-like domain-containing protein [Thermomonas carbonis]|uniref:Rhodanese-like domain-containing protein n=1 Tax=Thermomonas carbonis TaxID=1463158 RepID=A0A7G9SRK0_9GAMM|nr:rhodanese-like domain-containing protein [Thermomonas carbonis]QNN70475.1 rhodanese-like domain-containing protein [Thermomonas carbonis]GHC00284.1 rhodanese-like domain-containing protein [Thermomonas carbonis]
MSASTAAADLVAEARSKIREVAPREFRATAGDAVVIDVREPSEFETGHIPGSINIPRGVLEFRVDAHPAVANVSDPALSHKERPIVVVCRTGGRAALSAVNLQRLGFVDVRSIAGGVLAWGEAGLSLVVR